MLQRVFSGKVNIFLQPAAFSKNKDYLSDQPLGGFGQKNYGPSFYARYLVTN
jgi:hypothetical protein